MKVKRTLAGLAVVVGLLAWTTALAVQVPRAMFPLATNPLQVSTLTTVLKCACGFANSVMGPDNNLYTIAQRFDRGGRLFVYRFDGTVLVEVVDPEMVGPMPNSNEPTFGLPVQKNGPGSILFTPGPNPIMVIIAPARPVGVVEGDYNLIMYRVALSELE